MLFRLVRPVKCSGSSIPCFVQRIPADVRSRAIGRTLEVPCGPATVAGRVSPKMEAVRFSLRTSIPAEVKRRQAEAARYLEGVWSALRAAGELLSLTHRQATALAGRLYRAWADGAERERTIAVLHTPAGWVVDRSKPREEAAGFESALANLMELGAASDGLDLEPHLGPLVDRLLLAEGIARVDEASRAVILSAFLKALQDAMRSRKRNAEGDYSEDPAANHYPPPEAVNSRTGKTVRGSDLAGLNVIFGWAVANRRLSSNPAAGITLTGRVCWRQQSLAVRGAAICPLRSRQSTDRGAGY